MTRKRTAREMAQRQANLVFYKKQYKGKKVGVRKEGSHWLATIGGEGYSLHATKSRAKKEANAYRRQLGRK